MARIQIVDIGDAHPPHAPVDVVADWNGCHNAASVWNGHAWVSCDGPRGHIDNRCPDCDFRSND
jgi:hypothetical protein